MPSPSRSTRLPTPLRPLLGGLLLFLLAGVGGPSALAAPADALTAHRAALTELRGHPQSGAVAGELASYDAWLRAASMHAQHGQDDALQRTRLRLDAQQSLIEARLQLLETRAAADKARNSLRALDRRIAEANSAKTILERHQERTRKRGQ